MEETSIPPWAEARMKSRLASEWTSAGEVIGRSLAYEYDVLFYRLDLRFPMVNDSLSGTALIRCRSEKDSLGCVYLHLEGLTVDSVLVDGTHADDWSDAGGWLYVNLPRRPAWGDTFELLVAYGGSPDGGYYITGSDDLRTGFTITEPSDSRYWFPCWDEPSDKADEGCEIRGEVPLGFVVASNGLLIEVDTTYYASDTTVTYHWQETFPISTYLISVAIAQYSRIPDIYVTDQGDTIEVLHFVYGQDSSSAVTHFAETPDMMEFFAPIFGEYPFEKYGMACVTRFGGGMEHQTMTTITRGAALYGWEDGISHELAHMWWGDMVTCADWPDIWLNEGFATYSEVMWHEHKYGFSSFKDKITEYGNDYFQGGSTRSPLYDPPALFDWGLVYVKGAWVLHMFRHMVGDSLFQEVLQAYGEKFKYGNATTEDLRAVVDSVTNDTFDYYFQQWVYSPEHPRYEYGWVVEELGGNDFLLHLRVLQEQQYGPLFRMPVDLQLTYTGGDTTLVVWLQAEVYQEISLSLVLPVGSANFSLAFDPDNWLLDEHEEVPYTEMHGQEDRFASGSSILYQNQPNPFRSTTSITLILPSTGDGCDARLSVYNSLGERVRILMDGSYPPGRQMVTWDGTDADGSPVRNGIYFCQLEVSGAPGRVTKMLLLR
jgi:aminopeptidase N